MEKNKAHYNLMLVKELVRLGNFVITRTALSSATLHGLNSNDIINEILSLSNTELYKSMTTYNNSKVWQDVYHHVINQKIFYIKISIVEKVIIVSFKEK